MTYAQHKRTAKQRGIENKLTLEQHTTLVTSPCAYCGGEGGGIDRLNPKGGYTVENSVSACKRCNARKQAYEHLGLTKAVANAMAMAHRNKTPPPSEREWKMIGCYKWVG
jgi:hypothetical protein